MTSLPINDVTFYARVVVAESGCHEWIGTTNPKGYGHFYVSSQRWMAHRYALMLAGVSVPSDKLVDHLCRNHGCVNPDHLDIVTSQINTLRGVGPTAVNAAKTHCIHGHEFSDDNTYHRTAGRSCRTCLRIADQRYRDRRKSA